MFEAISSCGVHGRQLFLVWTLWAPWKTISELLTLVIDYLSCEKIACRIQWRHCENVHPCLLHGLFDHSNRCQDKFRMEFYQYSMGDGECSAKLNNQNSWKTWHSCVCSLPQQTGIHPNILPALYTAFAILASIGIFGVYFQVILAIKKTWLVQPWKRGTLGVNFWSFKVKTWFMINMSTAINHGVLVQFTRSFVFMIPCDDPQITPSMSCAWMVHEILVP